jgi:hypothetical protein
MHELNLNITARARQHIEDLLRRYPEGSIPALMLGRSETFSNDGALLSESPYRFHLAVYPLDQAEQIDRDLAAHGYTALYRVGELTVLIPQTTVVTEQVEGRTLDAEGDTICIV